MPVFDPQFQHEYLYHKIIVGLERIAQLFKTLLWEFAAGQGISPIQIQLLIFIRYHSARHNTVSYLAKEFSVTRPTISDAIKVLEQKGLLKKHYDASDLRSFHISLSPAGKKMVALTERYTQPMLNWLAAMPQVQKENLWLGLTHLLGAVSQDGIMRLQRSCYHCAHRSQKGKDFFCGLLQQKLATKDIRIDCPEFEEMDN